MRSHRAIVALILVGTACGGGTAETSTTAPGSTGVTTTLGSTSTTGADGFMVTSEDGDVTIEVPFEAMAEDPGIVIRVLDPLEYPVELAGAAANPGAVIYSMEPDGLVFDAPVQVTRRVPVANFPDLPEGAIPIVTLVTSTADGSGFEYLGDLEVLLDGDDLFVSGETTHFSPLVSVSEATSVRVVLPDTHFGFKTELGILIRLTPEFYGANGAMVASPSQVTGAGFTRSDDALSFVEADHAIDIDCSALGEFGARFGFDLVFRIGDDSADQAKLNSSPNLVSGFDEVEVLVKQAAPIFCLDPATSLSGLKFPLMLWVDHPGGAVYIANEDYGGGYTGGLVDFGDLSRLAGAWAGVIQDSNRNGMVDYSDRMYPVYPVVQMQEHFQYVAPFYSMNPYFIYVVDGNQFDWTPGEGYDAAPVSEHLPLLEALYTGEGRFEAAIAVVAVGGNPFVWDVGPGEDVQTEPDAVLKLFFELARPDF